VANVIAALSRFAFPSQRSTRTNPAVISTAGTPQLVLTVDKEANNEALRRIHEWFASVNLAQILYRTTGTNHLMIQGCDGAITRECDASKQSRSISRNTPILIRLSSYVVRSNNNGYSAASLGAIG
jgi:hypothetical protein